MNRAFKFGAVCFGIALGFVAGCLITDQGCSDDWICGYLKEGVYGVANYDDHDLIGDTPEDRVTVEQSEVIIEYGRSDGSRWKVIYRKTGEVEYE